LKRIGLYNCTYHSWIYASILVNSSIQVLVLNNLEYSENDYSCIKLLNVCRRNLTIQLYEQNEYHTKKSLTPCQLDTFAV